jgi:hypothetical protein
MHIFTIELAEERILPNLPTSFGIRVETKDALESKLSEVCQEEIRILFIDSLDMKNRQYDSQISTNFSTVGANIKLIEIIE